MPGPASVLTVSPLTQAAFSPFGSIVQPGRAGRAVNRGEAVRHDHVADLASLRENAAANLALFEIRRGAPHPSVSWLERHPHSTQLFLPLSAGRFAVTVAPESKRGGPDCVSARAFLAGDGVGLTYCPGIWHHGLIPLDGAMRFAMLVWEDGSAGDCEIVDLATPFVLDCAELV